MAGLEDSSIDYQDNDSDNNSGSDNAQDNSDSGSNSSRNSGSNSGSSDDNASSSNDSDDDQEKSEAEKSDEDNDEEKSEEERSEEERSDDDEQSEGEQSEQERSESDQSEGEKDAASDSSSKNEENCRMTQVNFDESDTQDSRTSRTAPRQLKQHWESQPELYGIRRSGRQRKEPTRLQAGLTSGSDDDQPKRRRRRQRTESDDWNVGRSQSDEESEDDYKPSKRVVRAATQARSSRSSQKKGRAAAAAKSKSSQRRRKHSSSESDNDYSSDDDVRARHHSRRKTTAKVRSKSRSSKRKGTKRVSYKEVSENDMTDSDDLIEQNYDYEVKDEEELNRETIEKILDHRYGKKGDVGNGTALYNRIKASDQAPEEKPQPSPKPVEVKVEEETEGGDAAELEVQYFIKWKNWAHIHNTWETEATLKAQKVQGMKKLEKYKQTEAEFQNRMRYSNKDEIEWELVNREMERALFQEYFTAERVIAKMAPRTEGAEPDLLVKWCGLPYSEATWEDMNLIKARFPSQVDAFNARQSASTIPSKSGKAAKSRPKFVPLKTQPEYLGGDWDTPLELRNYQLDGLNWLLGSWTKRNSVILADEMGLGKTIQIISFLSVLMNTHQVYGPFLVVVPLSTIAAWQREFQRWAPMMNVIIYIGDIKSRSVMRDCEWYKMGTKSLKFNVVVTTYEILLKDKSFVGSVDWQVLAVDEAHRLKNDDSLLYKCLKDFKTSHRILITGTPLQNSLKELWSLLHFIMPERFDSWEDFQERYENVDEQGNKVVRYKDIHKELEQYLIRRVKKDVEKSLPAKVEQILRVEMSSMQRHIYKLIVTKNFKALSKGTKGPISSFLNIMMELKKCCNHTLLIKEPDNPNDDKLQALIRGSGKLILLDKLLCRLRDNHRVLIFSQMVRMLDILAEYLTLRGFPFQRLDGSVKSEMRKQALDHFNAEGSLDFCFLLSTRAGGLGINLATADTVIIFDSDWNPQNDLQAQARAHRIGQQKQVSVYRLVTKNSVEEDIVERAKKKMVLDHLVIQRMDTTGRTTLNKTGPSSSNPFNKEELASILKFGAEQLFKEEDEEDPQVDIDEVLKMAETHNTDATTPGSEFLSNFKVVSFDNMEEDDLMDTNTNQDDNDNEPSWDDIIPADFRAKVEAEQTEEELKKMYLGPRKRKTVMNGGYDSNSERHRRKGDQDGDDEDEEEEGSNEDGDDRPKKRGRPRTRDKVKGFTDAEIRRFIKSFKKFAAPLTRLDAIACDAELQEKSEADLKRLGEMLFNECTKAMEEYKAKLKEDPSFEEKKTHRGPTLKLSNVMINAQSVTKANNDLEPLAKEIPADEAARNKYHLQCRVKAVHWDKPWDVDDDSNLLKGVYMYGMGSWENIKMDPSLKLSDRILPDEVNAKPQAKHLQTRVDYLLKVLAKHHEMGAPVSISSGTSKGTGRGRRRKPKSKAEIIEDDFSSDDNATRDETRDSMDVTSSVPTREVPPSNGSLSLTEGESLLGPPESKPKEKEKKKKKKKKKASSEEPKHKSEEKEETEEGEKHKHKEKEHKENSAEKKPKKKKEKKIDGPLHFTASAEPHSVTPDDLPPQVYEWCKASMKPMKKQLKKILEISEKEKKDTGDSEMYKNLLVRIGRHISEILADITDVADIQQKRGYLWSFCTIFHPGMKARKLHMLYKKYLERQQDESRSALASEASQSSVSSFSQSRPDFSKKRPHPPDRPGDDKERSSKKHKSNHDRSQDGFPKHKHSSSGSNRPKGSQDGGQKPLGVSKRPWGQLHRPEPPTSSPSSSTVGWTQASPLARTEDINMSRYSSAGAYSGWHDPHRNQSHGLEHKSDTYHRYNNDRQGGMGHHYGRDHNRGMGGFHGDNRGGGDHHRSGDHRGDHHRSSGYGHYSRPSEHGSYHSRPGDDRGSGGYHSHMHRDRKRWSDDHGDSSDRRPFKDPRPDHRSDPRTDSRSDPRTDSRSDPRTDSRSDHRTDPRMEHRSPLPTEHRSPFMADPRTPVLPPVAGATGHH